MGAPHPIYGEVPVAYVALHPERSVTETELRDMCTQHLTKIKVPVSITITGALPKNPVGKIDKPGLRAGLAQKPAQQGV